MYDLKYACKGRKNNQIFVRWLCYELKKCFVFCIQGNHVKLAREVLDAAIRSVRPGMTTDDIDKLVHMETIARNAYPSPLNYHGFPKSCCTSINEVRSCVSALICQ